MLFIWVVRQRESALCIMFPPVLSNWASEGQRAYPGHDHSTGTLPGQSVGSELFLQSFSDAPDPVPPAAAFIFSSLQSLGDNSEGFQGKEVHSPILRQFKILINSSHSSGVLLLIYFCMLGVI